MRRQAIILIMLVAVMLQASLGGMRSRSIVLCFGGECPEQHTQPPQPAQLAESVCHHGRCCESELSVPQPVPADEHHEHRGGCTDIELTVVDLTTVRTSPVDVPTHLPALLPAPLPWQIDQECGGAFAPASLALAGHASAPSAFLAAVRAVRIQV